MAGATELLQRGMALHRGGDLAGAAREYGAILAREPDHPDALHLLGLIAYREGRLEDARALIGRALAGDPRNPVFHANLGNVAKDAGDVAAAAASYRSALDADPRMPAPRNNLGTLLLAQRRFDEAVACFRGVLDGAPDHARAWFNLGCALAQQGSLAAAADAHQRGTALAPDHAQGWGELGLTLLALGRLDEAVQAFGRRVDADPTDAGARADLALALHRRGDLEAARAHYEQALAQVPDALEVRCNYGALLQKTCDWGRLAQAWRPVVAAIEAGRPGVPAGLLVAQPGVDPALQWAAARANAATWADVAPAFAEPAMPVQRVAPQGASRLRIGYLSGDFRAHATAYLTAGLFECHDRARCEVVLLSYGPNDGSAMRVRLESGADAFVELSGMSDEAAAGRIAALGLDVLVDLNGNTDNGRIGIAARRPAPVQVSWLGFPGTLGAPFYDYLVADHTVIPAGSERWYTEQVVRLPGTYQCNDRRRPRPLAAPGREALGLPVEAVVLCCFNQAFKITEAAFGLWLDVLTAVPRAMLWLLEDNPLATAALRDAAQARGILPARLMFAPHRPLEEHLARYWAADLAIDTFPCSSHTTASDSLWMGCPLATLAGETFAARVAASLLTAAGLGGLVARSQDEYRGLLIRLAGDPVERDRARTAALAVVDSPLFDTPRFARGLERAYTTMVERHHAGAAPRAFDIAD